MASTTNHIEPCPAYSYGLVDKLIVHHYLPANFPMNPCHHLTYIQECKIGWDLLMSGKTNRMKQYAPKPGVVLMYDEFFFRLFEKDSNFQIVFPNVEQRGALIIRIIAFMLNETEDIDTMIQKTRYLGYRHKTFGPIRPHHFGILAQTLVEVIMFWLGENASKEIAEAWSHIVGFFNKHLLESFLYDRVNYKEFYQEAVVIHKLEFEQVNTKITARSSTTRIDHSSRDSGLKSGRASENTTNNNYNNNINDSERIVSARGIAGPENGYNTNNNINNVPKISSNLINTRNNSLRDINNVASTISPLINTNNLNNNNNLNNSNINNNNINNININDVPKSNNIILSPIKL